MTHGRGSSRFSPNTHASSTKSEAAAAADPTAAAGRLSWRASPHEVGGAATVTGRTGRLPSSFGWHSETVMPTGQH